MESIEQRHLEGLSDILNQRLDDYGLEIIGYTALEGVAYNTLVEMKHRTERFLEALEKATK